MSTQADVSNGERLCRHVLRVRLALLSGGDNQKWGRASNPRGCPVIAMAPLTCGRDRDEEESAYS